MLNHAVNQSIHSHLRLNGVEYQTATHGETTTSQEAAEARGEPLWSGAKALVIKVDGWFGLFVLRAALQLESGAIRRHLKTSRTRFATREELFDLVRLVPGSVPPFGEPILPLPLYQDVSLRDGPRVAFNAASLTESIIMPTESYLRVAQPVEIFAFSRPAPRSNAT